MWGGWPEFDQRQGFFFLLQLCLGQISGALPTSCPIGKYLKLLGNESDHSSPFVPTVEDALLPYFLASARCGADTHGKLSHYIDLDQGFQVMSLHKSVTYNFIYSY